MKKNNLLIALVTLFSASVVYTQTVQLPSKVAAQTATATNVIGSLTSPKGLTCDLQGNLYLLTGSSPVAIQKLNSNNQLALVVANTQNATSLAAVPGDIIIAAETDRLAQYTSAGASTAIADQNSNPGLGTPLYLQYLPSGELVFSSSNSHIFVRNSAGTISDLGVLSQVQGIAYSPHHQVLMAVSPSTEKTYIYSPAALTSALPTAKDGETVFKPAAVAVDVAGNFFVASKEEGIIFSFDKSGAYQGYIDPEGSSITSVAFCGTAGNVLYYTNENSLGKVELLNTGFLLPLTHRNLPNTKALHSQLLRPGQWIDLAGQPYTSFAIHDAKGLVIMQKNLDSYRSTKIHYNEISNLSGAMVWMTLKNSASKSTQTIPILID